jgi:sn-glycerol 3-phosphate transport system permease protein
MVERRPALTVLAHLVLALGILIVALPIWLTFVASTQQTSDMLKAPIPVWPGAHMVENYATVLGYGVQGSSSGPVGPMLLNSLVMALGIALGKIAISILSAFAIVYFRFPLRGLADLHRRAAPSSKNRHRPRRTRGNRSRRSQVAPRRRPARR